MDPSVPFLFTVHIPRAYFDGQNLHAHAAETDDDSQTKHSSKSRDGDSQSPTSSLLRGEVDSHANLTRRVVRIHDTKTDGTADNAPHVNAIEERVTEQQFERKDVFTDVHRILGGFGIRPAWSKSTISQDQRDGTPMSVVVERQSASFIVLCNADLVYESLVRYGVGVRFGSVCAVPATNACVARLGVEASQPTGEDATADPGLIGVTDLPSRVRMYKQSRAREFVHRIVLETEAAAAISFDYVSLVVIASVIAAMGLAQNSPVAVVAAMLVSPLMGPVMACTFGTVIRDFRMVRRAIVSEALGLSIALVLGFVAGLCMSYFGPDLGWPNAEMESRGSVSGLYFGIVVASASGVGVALSILKQNTSSLVGVAISASLLPPAVNAGMNWAYAAIGPAIHGSATVNAHQHARIGGISLALTALNIALIYISAMIVFKMKEVAPVKVSETSNLFRDDVKEAREYVLTHRTVRGDSADSHMGLAQRFGLLLGRHGHDRTHKKTDTRRATVATSTLANLSVHPDAPSASSLNGEKGVARDTSLRDSHTAPRVSSYRRGSLPVTMELRLQGLSGQQPLSSECTALGINPVFNVRETESKGSASQSTSIDMSPTATDVSGTRMRHD